MKLYNTLTKKKEDFKPIDENEIKMYVCGPTVYNYIHIGNARPYIVFDALRRYFEYLGFVVNFVQNFTDVDDKIINKANAENVHMNVISDRYVDAAKEDARAVNVKDATVNPRVTQEIDGIIEMIKTLIEKGFAYEKNGSVFFSSSKFEDYGKLSKKKIDELELGARIEIDDEKENPTDFVLWKPRKPDEPYWDSPWSEGRPGWHIECSVMAKKYLGDTIDIHAGGEDLIFPHHENEIAQSEAANGKPFANYWLHNGTINIDNKKMSKSDGDFFQLRDILKQFSGDVIRFFILSSHYRSPVNFNNELILSSQTGLERIKNCVSNLEFLLTSAKSETLTDAEENLINESKNFLTSFNGALDDDFNTASALSVIFEVVRFANSNATEKSSRKFIESLISLIKKLGEVLGFDFSEQEKSLEAEIESLIAQRTEARKNKDFKASDEIRDKLNDMGIVLEDTRLGVKWSFKEGQN